MTDYKELFDVAKVNLDSKIEQARTSAKQEAEDFFEKNKISLTDCPLRNIIREMRHKVSTKFIDTHTYDKNISLENDEFRAEFKNTLCGLIISTLKEMSPNYCNYDVHVEETVHYTLSIKITMTIFE